MSKSTKFKVKYYHEENNMIVKISKSHVPCVF